MLLWRSDGLLAGNRKGLLVLVLLIGTTECMAQTGPSLCKS